MPIVAKETTLDRFKNKEAVAILGKRKDWYRVTSPSRFKAWVKTSELDALENRAASTVRTPAAAPTVTASANTPSNDRATSVPPNPFSPLSEREAQIHHDWLFAQDPNHFTIQLASFDEPDAVVSYLQRLPLANDARLHQFQSITNNRFWTYFVYGSFNEKAAAERTKVSLGQQRGLVRIFGKLQKNRCLSWYLSDPQSKQLQQYCANLDYQAR